MLVKQQQANEPASITNGAETVKMLLKAQASACALSDQQQKMVQKHLKKMRKA